jgi:hypothetical protein
MYDYNTVLVVQREPLTKIFDIDADGDGSISKPEYILFMLREMRDCNSPMINILGEQFEAMDTDGSGTLEPVDFPDDLECEITTTLVNQNITHVKWVVVPKDPSHEDTARKAEEEEEKQEEETQEAEEEEKEEVPLAKRVSLKPALSAKNQLKQDAEVRKIRSECEERIREMRSQYEEKIYDARASQYQVELENAKREYQRRLDALGGTIEKMQQDSDSKLKEKNAGIPSAQEKHFFEKLDEMEKLRGDYNEKLGHLERRVSVAPMSDGIAESPSEISHENHVEEKAELHEAHFESQRRLVAHQEEFRQRSDDQRTELNRDLGVARLDIERLEHALQQATMVAQQIENPAANEMNKASEKLIVVERKIASLEKELNRALQFMDADAEEFEVFVVDDPTAVLPEECGE